MQHSKSCHHKVTLSIILNDVAVIDFIYGIIYINLTQFFSLNNKFPPFLFRLHVLLTKKKIKKWKSYSLTINMIFF